MNDAHSFLLVLCFPLRLQFVELLALLLGGTADGVCTYKPMNNTQNWLHMNGNGGAYTGHHLDSWVPESLPARTHPRSIEGRPKGVFL